MIRADSQRSIAGEAPAALVGGTAAAMTVALLWGVRTIALKGTTGVAEVLGVLVSPLLLWLAWARPIVFPYGLYLIVAPLDVLTLVSKQDGTVARLLGFASAAAFAFYMLRTGKVRVPPRTLLWLGLFCAWASLSALWSVGDDPWRELGTLLQISALYLIIACFPTRRRDLLPLLGALLLGGLFAAGMGIYEFRSGAQEAQTLSDMHRITVTLGRAQLDPNMYADSLLLPFAIALAWFVRARRFASGLAAGALMAAFVVAIALAGSRDAFIGLGIETVILATLMRGWRRVALPVAALIGTVLAIFPNVITRALEDSGGGYGRTSIWHVGLAAFAQHPFVGSGVGSFAAMYDEFYLRVFERYDVGWNMASHDLLVHYGVEFGLVGLALVLGWGAAQWLMARALPRAGLYGDIRSIALASLGGLTFAAMFIDLFDVKFVWFVFALIVQARNAAIAGEG
jgi:O-antigen ligase